MVFYTFDIERLRYLAIDYEWYICFENETREEFISNRFELWGEVITPENGFIESYEYWMNLDEGKVREEIEHIYGLDFFNDIFKDDIRKTSEIKEFMDSEYNKYVHSVK